jgi:hypothetical protein
MQSTISLTELGLVYDTDKAYWHRFTGVYETWLSSYRTSATRVLEIGVANGSSLKMWRDYFPNADIVGVDILDRWWVNADRIKTYIVDQSSKESIDAFLKTESKPFDIIIDDGSHLPEHQMTNLEYFWDALNPGGVYIIEDLHTSQHVENGGSASWTMKNWSTTGKLESDHIGQEYKIKIQQETTTTNWWKRSQLPLQCYNCKKTPGTDCKCGVDWMNDGGGSITSCVFKLI